MISSVFYCYLLNIVIYFSGLSHNNNRSTNNNFQRNTNTQLLNNGIKYF